VAGVFRLGLATSTKSENSKILSTFGVRVFSSVAILTRPLFSSEVGGFRRARLPLTGAESTEFSATPQFTPKPEIRTPTGPTHEDASSEKVNGKKRPFPPSETPTGNSEDPGAPALASASENKRQRRNRKDQNAQAVATREKATERLHVLNLSPSPSRGSLRTLRLLKY